MQKASSAVQLTTAEQLYFTEYYCYNSFLLKMNLSLLAVLVFNKHVGQTWRTESTQIVPYPHSYPSLLLQTLN